MLASHTRSSCRGGDSLNLNFWQWSACPTEISRLSLRVLAVVIADGGFDGVLSKHRAVYWHGGKHPSPSKPNVAFL